MSSERLEKAKAAVEAAKDAQQGTGPWLDLLQIAQVQALIAIAEVLEA